MLLESQIILHLYHTGNDPLHVGRLSIIGASHIGPPVTLTHFRYCPAGQLPTVGVLGVYGQRIHARDASRSLHRIVPSAIFGVVTALSVIFGVVTAPSAIFGVVTAPSAILGVVTAPLPKS